MQLMHLSCAYDVPASPWQNAIRQHLVSGRVQLSILAIFLHIMAKALEAMRIRPPTKWDSIRLTWAHFERFRPSAQEVDRILIALGSAVEPGTADILFHSADIFLQLCDLLQGPEHRGVALIFINPGGRPKARFLPSTATLSCVSSAVFLVQFCLVV